MGDDEDLYTQLTGKADEDEEDKWYIPVEVERTDFLVRMGWTNEEVFHSQSLWWYDQQKRIYDFQKQTGLLDRGLL